LQSGDRVPNPSAYFGKIKQELNSKNETLTISNGFFARLVWFEYELVY
jgi:hypothetical protein